MTDRTLGGEDRWVGKVVSVMDPKEQGRIQVRVFGRHDDEVKIPDNDLPWAIPVIPITQGASSKGRGKAPVGVVPGTVVEGRYIDADHSILRVEGSLASAGKTRPGRMIDGSYEIDPTDNDVAHGARGDDRNAGIGLKNLPATGQKGSSFSSISAGVGFAATRVTSLLSQIRRVDPNNLSGSIAGSVNGMYQILSINEFIGDTGVLDLASDAIKKVLATAAGLYGISAVVGAVNDMAGLTPNALIATNAALSALQAVARTGGTQGILEESLSGLFLAATLYDVATPGMNRGPLGQVANGLNVERIGAGLQGYTSRDLGPSAALVNTMAGIQNLQQVSQLQGLNTILPTIGAVSFASGLIVDLASDSLIDKVRTGLDSIDLGSGINSLMDDIKLGGLNLVLGAPLQSLAGIAGIVGQFLNPQTASLINTAISIVGTTVVAAPAIASLFDSASRLFALADMKKSSARIASEPLPPPEASAPTTTGSIAVTSASSSQPSKPTVGSVSVSDFEQQKAAAIQKAFDAPDPVTETSVQNEVLRRSR